MRHSQGANGKDLHRSLKLLVEQETNRGTVTISRSDFTYLGPWKTKAQSSPQKARSAVDFQKVWQPISLHAKVLANLIIPAIYSRQTVNYTIEKVHHQNQTLLGSEEYSQGFLLRCHYNSMLFLILFFGFCPTKNSQVTGGPWTMSRCIKSKNTSLLLVYSKINTTRSTCD